MKKIILSVTIFVASIFTAAAQTQFKVVTTIESVVPGGVGRSRIIQENSDIEYQEFTTERTDGKKSDQKDVKRSEAKVDKFYETKILNFYSLVGINFQNIASNDALFSSMLNDMSAKGWELFSVTSGVESDAGKDDGNGIFITRYIFKKN